MENITLTAIWAKWIFHFKMQRLISEINMKLMSTKNKLIYFNLSLEKEKVQRRLGT